MLSFVRRLCQKYSMNASIAMIQTATSGRAEVIWHRSGKSDLASIWVWNRSGDCSIKRADLANLDLAKKFRNKPCQEAYPHVIMVGLENKPIWIERATPKQCNNVRKSQCVSDAIGIWGRSGKTTRSGIDCDLA